MFLPSLAFLPLLWRLGDTAFQAIWVERWVIFGLLGFLALMLRLKSSLPYLKAFLVFVGTMLWVRFLYPGWDIGTDPELVMGYRATVAQAAMLLVAWVGFLSLPARMRGAAGVILLLGAQALAVVSIWVAHDATLELPLLINPGMAACLLALPTPFYGGKLTGALKIASIIQTRTRTPWVILLARVLLSPKLPRLLKVSVILVLGLFLYWHGLPDSGGRLALWAQACKWWVFQPWHSWFFGLGIGTSYSWLPEVQDPAALPAGPGFWFLVLHNDWLQLFFELGAVGVTLGGLLLHEIWRRSQNREMLVSLSAWMLTDYPWHWGWTALLCLCLALPRENAFSEK